MRPGRAARRRAPGATALIGLAIAVLGCAGGPTGRGSTGAPASPPSEPAPSAPAGSAVLVGAGDIAACDAEGRARLTARLVETAAPASAIVFTAGDNAYPSGTPAEFERCYAPTWGAFRDRTRPAAGNHDWETPGAAGYRGYFGAAVGPPDATWYAYDAGSWRVIVLDSDCGDVGGCDAASLQGRWLAAELADHPVSCSVAIWHHPRFSSGERHGSDPDLAALFAAVADAGVDLVVNGHEHSYERFARLAVDGSPDPAGIRQIVVGTGGAEAYGFGTPLPGSEKRISGIPAVLVLELDPGAYRWSLVGGDRAELLDAGSDACRP